MIIKRSGLNKIKSTENIFLDESGEIIRNEVKVANVFMKYFVNMVPNMNLYPSIT